MDDGGFARRESRTSSAGITVEEREWAQKLRDHAKANYERGGWDFLVECWETSDIVNAFSGATSYEEAQRFVGEVLEVMDSRRKDHEAEEF